MTESEILMYVVAKAVEPTGTILTMASAQADAVCVRFAADEHLADLYEVGDEVLTTVQPVMSAVPECSGVLTVGSCVDTVESPPAGAIDRSRQLGS